MVGQGRRLSTSPSFLKAANIVLSGGFRIASREVDQTFGRYLINGLTAAGSAIGNCCADPNGGTYLYYLDPGYAAIPYSTAVSNPGLAKTVTNFATGQIIVKDPVTGGQTNPATYLNTVWNGGTNPASTNNSEKFFADGLEFVPRFGKDLCWLSHGRHGRKGRPVSRQLRRAARQHAADDRQWPDGRGPDLLRHGIVERRRLQRRPRQNVAQLHRRPADVQLRARRH